MNLSVALYFSREIPFYVKLLPCSLDYVQIICYVPWVIFICWHNTPFGYHYCAEIFEGIEDNADCAYSSEWVSEMRWKCPQMNVTGSCNTGAANGCVPSATSHYLSQCWPRSLSPYGVTIWHNDLYITCKVTKSFRITGHLCIDFLQSTVDFPHLMFLSC